ncbi:hypothetical protein BDR03DRAFT_969281 [Suillus americanus]|nr:hypothetical protein BDR03DRAFT_969281 [Suillus americanus]
MLPTMARWMSAIPRVSRAIWTTIQLQLPSSLGSLLTGTLHNIILTYSPSSFQLVSNSSASSTSAFERAACAACRFSFVLSLRSLTCLCFGTLSGGGEIG